MKLTRLTLAIVLMSAVVGLAVMARTAESPGGRMADAADGFLATLSPELKQKALFPAGADERTNWHFVPMQDRERNPTRKGLGIFEMNKEQREAAMALLKSGTSESGFTQATTIMSLEAILRELEKGGASVRNPEWYFVAIFGEPSKTGKWGWRIEGHHLSLNFLIENGEVVATTPFFYGSNPAEVMTGPNKGDRVLDEIEDIAFELIRSLDDDRKAKARQDKHFKDVDQTPKAELGEPVGLTAGEMTEAQRAILLRLIETYADRLPPELAKAERTRATKSGVENIRFAYSGTGERNKPHTYRIHGPTFVIEFLNVQADSLGNAGNHIHSVWRRLPADFGL